MVTISNIKYIQSKDIKVFPCAYRGYYNETVNPVDTLVFDPEARSTTEANFTNTFHKLSSKKDSYVIEWIPGTKTLKCVIGGYYFEIYNHDINDFFYLTTDNKHAPYYLNIKAEQETLASATENVERDRTTTILSSFAESVNYLDSKQVNGSETKYYFTGLAITTEAHEDATAYLQPFKVEYSGEGDSETEVFKVDPSKLSITALLDTSTGEYSVRMIEDTAANSTVASGDYAVALGRSSEASGVASIAFGNNTEASGDYSFAAGNNTKATNQGAVALGSNTTTNANNQVVIGAYNEEDENQAFIIANGTSTTPSNKFTVGYEGNVKALGNLEVKGSIKATGSAANDLELGTSTTNSTGSIKVYGTGANPVFQVENTGNTTIAGDTAISGDATISGSADITGTTNISGVTSITNDTEYTAAEGETPLAAALKVTGGMHVGKKLNVASNTTIGGTFTADGNTILGGNSTTNVVNIKKSPGDGEVNVKITGSAVITNTTTIQGAVGVTKDTESNSKTTGAFIVTGGVGIGKNLNVGGDANINNKLIVKTSPATTETNVKVDGTLNVTGKTDIYSNVTIDSNKTTLSKSVEITDTTSSTTTTTGALKVSGGVGITGNVNIGGALTTTSTTTSGGKLTVSADGADINGNVNVIDGTLTSAKKLTVSSEGADIIGDIILKSNSTTNRLTIKNTPATGEQNIMLNGTVGITGNSTITGTLSTTSTTTSGGKLTVSAGGADISGGIDITGGAEIAGGLDVTSGGAEIAGGLRVSGNSKVTGTFEATDNTVIGGTLKVNDTVNISKSGITGINSLSVSGLIEAQYFNARTTTTSSDARLKCNIEDFKFNKSILDLPIKAFEYINDENHTRYIGCIAQELQEICPELVTTDKDGYLAIQENKLIYALLQEVKELKEKVENLERR